MSNHIENDLKGSIVDKSKTAKWIEDRLPVFSFIENTFLRHPYPKNLSYWWSFWFHCRHCSFSANHQWYFVGDALCA